MKCKYDYNISEKEVLTSHIGYSSIMKFYEFCKSLKYTSVNLNIWGVKMLVLTYQHC